MKILDDDILSKKQLPKSHTLILNSRESPSKLNIKLKAHSMTCLDIPLKTFVGINEISSSFRNTHQKTIAGSVDLISEIQQQQQPDTENLSHFSSSKPLINIVSSNQQLPKVQHEWRQILKHRFRTSSSFNIPRSFNDSVSRLRRNGHLQNIHQSSLQALNKITDRKHRLSFNHNGSIPKFTFRDLPSASSSINQSVKSSKRQMSPFTSLPEIRSFVAENCSDNSKTINDKLKLPPLSALPSWQRTSSWSWKSNDTIKIKSIKNEEIKPKIIYKEIPHQINHSNLPVIIESPLQQRSSLQINNENYQHHHHSSTRLTNKYRSNLSFHTDKTQQNSSRLYQRKSLFPHSISNYEVSPNQFSSQSTTRYPSTPLLAYARHKNLDKFDYHSRQFHILPLATFDDDYDSDSISSNSSFRSCINSIHEFSEMNTTELSSLSENSFQDMSSSYNLKTEIFNGTIKHSRLSIRHLCILQ